MNIRRNLWQDERIAYRSAIYRRATLRSMINDHNAGTFDLDGPHLNYCMDGICAETQSARSILYRTRARVLGYSR